MKKVFLAIMIIGGSLSLVAQQKEDRNFKGENARIQQGKASGEITKGEMKHIKHKKDDVRAAKQAAKADGVVTKEERKVIAKEDRQLDRTIQRTKHNSKKRK